MTPLQSQLAGLALAVFTALGCVAYEKIVKASQLTTILFLSLLFYVPVFGFFMVRDRDIILTELRRVCWEDPQLRFWSLIYFATWITTPLWFFITKKQSVMAGSLYEVKYVVLLGVLYFFLGQQRISFNLAAACLCTLAGIYFISRT